MANAHQTTLFDSQPLSFDEAFSNVRRVHLDEHTWLDVCRGWVGGHQVLFERLERTVAWEETTQLIWDQRVVTPRLVGAAPSEGPEAALIRAMSEALTRRYARHFHRVGVSLYRDGNDSVAFHRDKGLRSSSDSCVASVSLGAYRRFLVRPYQGGPSHRFSVGWGDLVVMGGACQRDWEHAIPKTAHADPRIALMFRHSPNKTAEV